MSASFMDKHREEIDRRLTDIKENRTNHLHDFNDLRQCATVEGALVLEILEAHDVGRTNGGRKCDVLAGPCACGAWH